MTKLFNVVGTSRVRAGAALKLRVANGKPERRARILERNGHADVALFSVEPGVSKDAALEWLQANYADLAAQLAPRKPKAAKVAIESTTAAVDATTAAVDATTEAVEATNEAVEATTVATETVALTAEEKLAAKRAKDAARKREKRAAAKLAAAA